MAECNIVEYTDLDTKTTTLFCETHEAEADNFNECEDAE